MTQKDKLPSFFDSGSGKSMMRWAVFTLILLSVILGISGMAVQFIVAIKGNVPDWTGFALFIGSITTLAVAAITGKWLQKKEEVKQEINTENNENN